MKLDKVIYTEHNDIRIELKNGNLNIFKNRNSSRNLALWIVWPKR